MTPDARIRMEVYQEGQRAFNSGAPCPYVDWRAGTWRKGWQAAATLSTVRGAAREVPPADEVKSAGWTVRRAGRGIRIESPAGHDSTLYTSQPDPDVFDYFDGLLKENGL